MEITIVFPHQLFADHPAITAGRPVALIEDPLFFGTDPRWPMRVHRQRLLLHRAALKAYGDDLRGRGLTVLHQRHDQAVDTAGHLGLLHAAGYRSFHLVDPVDDLLHRRLRGFVRRAGCELTISHTPLLLTPTDLLDEHFSGGRKPLMARFYEMQRRRLDLLIDADGGPLGGRWSYDADNRKKLPKTVLVPPEPRQVGGRHMDLARRELIQESLPGIGAWEDFAYPINHADASRWLDDFLEHRLQQFGAYEDAISTRHRVMWHGVLTPMLNCGLLTPKQVINRTMDRAGEGDIPINSLEGFLRQIIGWREFMAAMYRLHGVTMRNSNFWDFEDRPIPSAFYEGTTGLPPIDDAIQKMDNLFFYVYTLGDPIAHIH